MFCLLLKEKLSSLLNAVKHEEALHYFYNDILNRDFNKMLSMYFLGGKALNLNCFYMLAYDHEVVHTISHISLYYCSIK